MLQDRLPRPDQRKPLDPGTANDHTPYLVPEPEVYNEVLRLAAILELAPNTKVNEERVKEFIGKPKEIDRNEMSIRDGRFDIVPDVLRHGPYEIRIGKFLGEGANASVYEATVHVVHEGSQDPELATLSGYGLGDEHVVVKFQGVPKNTKHRENEEANATMLTHREIAGLSQNHMLYDAWSVQHDDESGDRGFVILMKSLKGGNKQDRLNDIERRERDDDSLENERRSPEKILETLYSLRSCMVQLLVMARRGYQHRDVKPANVILNEFRSRLTDFGLAMKVNTPKDNFTAGTPLYMTQLSANGERDVLADAHALLAMAGQELGILVRSSEFNKAASKRDSHLMLRTIAMGEAWYHYKPNANSEMYDDAGQPLTDLSDLIQTVVQPNVTIHEYKNPFGTQEMTKDNLVKTIRAILNEVHIMTQEQMQLMSRKDIQETLAPRKAS